MSIVEWIAAVFGFLCVWFFIQRHSWSWPTGLVQVVLLVSVFWQAKLYADMGLHLVYVVLQLYGWLEWSQSRRRTTVDGYTSEENSSNTSDLENRHHSDVRVRQLTPRGWLAAMTASVALSALIAFLLIRFTDASLPVVDSLIAGLSLVAQCLLAWRYLENWMLWIIVDVLGIGLFAYKGLAPTALLYCLFLVMAIVGLLKWKKTYRTQDLALA